MNETTLVHGGAFPHWVRRTALVAFSLLLLGVIALVFTRLIAARVPEQRATLEQLITDRTGLAVRFENVHFAWNLSGTSAVFTRVELTDPGAGRVRVIAPELRVEFDTWDFLRHQQFSLGHVTLRSPDIEIIGDALTAEETREQRPDARREAQRRRAPTRDEDERALIRRFTTWVELMPNGRIEVEGARVHLRRRGESGARHTFTLSQAVVSRGASKFNAYGTMLLARDVGQSLFVSTKLEGLAANSQPSGDLRLIARRVFLEKLGVPGVGGRGTIDAKLHLNAGLIESAHWQASARELELNGEETGNAGTRFDHVTLTGKLERDAHDVLLSFDDLQFTRGPRLERAPNLTARLAIEPGALRIARTTVQGERVPFMAAEFIAGVLAPQLANGLPSLPGGWTPTAGELRALHFDSGLRKTSRDQWTFSADLAGTEITRAADNATLAGVTAKLRLDPRGLTLEFDPAHAALMKTSPAAEPRSIQAGGTLTYQNDPDSPRWKLEALALASGDSNLLARGEWNADSSEPLTLEVARVDRDLLRDAWAFINGAAEPPALLAGVASGNLTQARLQLMPQREQDATGIDWRRSSGELLLSDINLATEDLPGITGLGGSLKFARGNSTLRVEAGSVEELEITNARLDWPRGGVPRMHANLAGELTSPVLQRALQVHGLDRMRGKVTLEADARGERELRSPETWRIAARLSEGEMLLAEGVPAIKDLAGTLRYGDRQIRGLALEGDWLGGPIEIEARRVNARAAPSLAINGSADAAVLLRLLGRGEAANRVTGQLAWNGVAQPMSQGDGWQVTLNSNLAGVESRLPEPFAKPRTRQVAVSADLRIADSAIRDFEIESGRSRVTGQVRPDVLNARFEIAGVKGELRRPTAEGARPVVEIDRLSLEDAPALLAMSDAVLPASGDVAVTIADLRHDGQGFGALDAHFARRGDGVEFSFESRAQSPHMISVQGTCPDSPSGQCEAEFTVATSQLAKVLDAKLPPEWPTASLRASGRISWPLEIRGEPARALRGQFELETRGADPNHQLFANASFDEGDVRLTNVQGSGPESDEVFRGDGRVGLLARDYDVTFEYEEVSLAASAAMPTPARARLSRAWSLFRGSVARQGWAEPPETRRVQWHGFWDSAPASPAP